MSTILAGSRGSIMRLAWLTERVSRGNGPVVPMLVLEL